jgi:diguanylate cyclase (GGDEF)-like protein
MGMIRGEGELAPDRFFRGDSIPEAWQTAPDSRRGDAASMSAKINVLPATRDARPAIEPASRLLPRQLSDAERVLFRSVGERRVLSPGEVIFRRGELGRTMFVIESGRVQLEFGDGVADKLIGPLEFFGELALFIGNHARVASAADACEIHALEAGAFEALLEREPKLMAQFMRRSFSYLVASEQQLIGNLKRRNEDLMQTLDSLRQTRTKLSTAERLVQTDELTGLCNRRGLYSYLDTLADRLVPGFWLGLLLVDLDHFKHVNDHYGHVAGDRVLSAVAQELQNACADGDLPIRLGGDEFALLAQVADFEELEARARQIVDGVRRLRFPIPLDNIGISVSIGGGICSRAGNWSVWYSDADSVLYSVKGEGGDGFRLTR